MPKYIDADKAISAVAKKVANLDAGSMSYAYYSACMDVLRKATTEAVREDTHGQWMMDDYGYCRCSECGYEFDYPEEKTPYCPGCGANMEPDPETTEEKQSVLGRRITELLKMKGITQRELAEMIGVTEGSMARYIKGDRVPKALVVENIARALDTTALYLFGLENESKHDDKMTRHKAICDGIHDLYERKNHDYGDSFGQSFRDHGILAGVIRIEDKFNRLKTLAGGAEQKVQDESIRDTLRDMANYAIMTLLEMEAGNEDTDE